jgi:hypothetical protein
MNWVFSIYELVLSILLVPTFKQSILHIPILLPQLPRIPTRPTYTPPTPPLRIKHRDPLRGSRPARRERSADCGAYCARDDGDGEEEDVGE